MITAYKWYSIARTTTIGAFTGIKVEFGESYRILLTILIDWGNAVISVQNSNLNNTIVASARLRQNGIHCYLDIKVSQSFSTTDFKIELYDNTYWEKSLGVSDLAGAILCVINDINPITPSTGHSYFITDENGDLVPKPKDDGSPRGIWTYSFISSGGLNPNAEGSGSISEVIVRFDSQEIKEEYISEEGILHLPPYPTIEDFNLSAYLTKEEAVGLYYPITSGQTLENSVYELNNAFNTFKQRFEKAFMIHLNEDGSAESVQTLVGLWTDSYISSGGKNNNTGEGGGGLSVVTIKFMDIPQGDEFTSVNGVVTLPKYPTIPDLSPYLLSSTAESKYQPKGNYLTSIPSEYITESELAVEVNSLNALISTKTNQTDFNALASRVSANETNISTNKTNINNNTNAISTLDDKVDAFIAKINKYFTFGENDIKANYGLWTDSYLSSGGQNSSGGGGGGLTSFSVIVNNKTYNSNNGTATITEQLQPLITTNNKLAYSLISGTPTSLPASDVSSWAKKSSLAASDVPNLSGTYLQINDGGIPMSTTTNLNRVGYGYVEGGWLYSGPAIAFGSSNGYTALLQQKAGDYELRVSYKANGTASGSWKTIAFTSDLDSYLSKSGGTLSKASSPILTLHRSDYSYDSAIEFSNAVDGRLGLIGIKGSSSDTNKRPFYHDGTTYNYIIHSGNYSSYALPIVGGEIKAADNQTPLMIDNTNTTLTQIRIQTNNENKANIGWSGNTGFTGYRLGVFLHSVVATSSIGIKDDGTPYYNNNTLIHSGNIGSQRVSYATSADKSRRADYIQTLDSSGTSWYGDQYMVYGQWGSDNILDWKVDGYEVRVDRAKKLNTARKIWGQSFDGTGNIENQNLTINKNPASNTGNWTRGIVARDSNDNIVGRIGFYGMGNTLSYAYIGNDYSYPWLKIDSNGNVGIGTTNPKSKLDVNGNISINGSIIPDSIAYNLGSSSYRWENVYSYGGNFAGAITLSGTATSLVASINYTRVGANYITFPSGGNFRITVGAGSDANTALLIYTNKNVECRANLSAIGNITTTGGRFYDSSDIRLKNIISDLSNLSLDTILSIPRVRYQWKKGNSITMIGTIAQPMIGKFDELLHKDSDGMYSVDYDSIGVIALEGVAKVKSEVDILRERITELEGKVKMLGGTV